MAKLNIASPSSPLFTCKALDTTKTDGSGLTGITSSTASLTVAIRPDNSSTWTKYTGANLQSITTIGTYSAPSTGKCRIGLVSDTDSPGHLEIQLLASVISGAVNSFFYRVSGAANMANNCEGEIQISNVPANLLASGGTPINTSGGMLTQEIIAAGTITSNAFSGATTVATNYTASSTTALLNCRLVILGYSTCQPAITLITSGANSTFSLLSPLTQPVTSGATFVVMTTDAVNVAQIQGDSASPGAWVGIVTNFYDSGTNQISAGIFEGGLSIDWSAILNPTAAIILSGTSFKDVQGKVLGGGSSTITGIGAWSDLRSILGALITGTGSILAAALSKFFGVSGSTLTTASANQSTDMGTLLTSARAGYLDNLNVGGAVASHADIAAINQSASRHMTLATVGQYEGGETYIIEMRTFRASDGSAVDADTNPTLTPTGIVSGNLSANLSAISHVTTGVYKWTYTPGATPTLEQITFDGSATISSATFTLSCYSQTVAEPTAVFTSTDKSNLTTIFNTVSTNLDAKVSVAASQASGALTAIAAVSTQVSNIANGTNALKVGSLTQGALALFVTTDTGQSAAANGSVAKLSGGAGGGSSAPPITIETGSGVEVG